MKEKIKDAKNFVILGLLISVAVMAVGFAQFSTNLNVNGNATLEGHWNWDIRLENVQTIMDNEKCYNCSSEYRHISNEEASFTAQILRPGDYTEFSFDITNYGDMDAYLVENNYSSTNSGWFSWQYDYGSCQIIASPDEDRLNHHLYDSSSYSNYLLAGERIHCNIRVDLSSNLDLNNWSSEEDFYNSSDSESSLTLWVNYTRR